MENDNNIRFSTLFKLNSNVKAHTSLLRINKLRMNKLYMSKLYQEVLEVLNAIQTKDNSNVERVSSGNKYNSYLALKWMLETGCIDDGLSSRYDEVLDAVAALLVKKYKDITVLPLIANMIFDRYRKGKYIYDLVWAFFECGDPASLIYIGERLNSSNPRDIELACKMLSFVPNVSVLNKNRYASFQNWFNENKSFLYYKEESFQQLNCPRLYAVSLEAKYLCTAVSPEYGKIQRQLTSYEKQSLSAFNNIDNNARLLLANYSFFLFRQNYYLWNIWIQYPICEQIRIAQAAGGM